MLLAIGAACTGPISTMRSPYHLRIVEVQNLTDELRTLAIEPAPDQHLGAATTFTGPLAPGEVKVLYLYHGFDYVFRILDASGHREIVRHVVEVKRDVGLAYAGDSLVSEARLVAELGEPTFADSLQQYDPFGLRSGRAIVPDSTRGQHDPYGVDAGGRRGGANETPQ
ncbi:MAG TPA: hypothetical protein VM737_07255 [Gemmatimonadota bacterium]|nr:hypothetical protein [Gemmatimonadota bacterium]